MLVEKNSKGLLPGTGQHITSTGAMCSIDRHFLNALMRENIPIIMA